MKPLHIEVDRGRFQAMIGVGGIGTGVFFALNGNHTLGREESRDGHFLDRRDYCKLHIIAHYVRCLAGPDFHTVPIGKVGDDKEGRQLLEEMEQVGLDLRYVEKVSGGQTLFSFCFVYPDGSGGNLTTDDSANSIVDSAYVENAQPEFSRYAGRAVALAAPEAPLPARAHFLHLAETHGLYTVASLTTSEIKTVEGKSIMASTDLLALNRDEAATLADMAPDSEMPAIIERLTQKRPDGLKPESTLVITAGAGGSWLWSAGTFHHQPAIPAPVVSTAGAGDAFLGGMIVGLVAGLTTSEAQELATVVAAFSVTSPHTIHPGLDRLSLQAFAQKQELGLSSTVSTILGLT